MSTVFYLVASLINGFIFTPCVLMLMWGWYVAPFFGLPNLTYVHAVGLNMIPTLVFGGILLCVREIFTDLKGEDYTNWHGGLINLILPVIVLIFGWLFHFLI